MPSYEFTYESTPELARRAAQLMIWRRAGWWLVAMCIALVILLALLAVGERGWFLYVALGIGLSKLYAWFAYYRKSAQPFSDLSDPQVNVQVDEAGIEFQLKDGGSRIAWTAPIHLRISEKLWLLGYFSDRAYTIIPTTCMEKDVQDFIQTKVTENGGRVS